jgi:hypothetical protein
MASTTEELTGQSEQLVSALDFFRTRDEGHTNRKTTRPDAKQPVSAAGSGTKAGSGINLRLKDKHDELDGEFERY